MLLLMGVIAGIIVSFIGSLFFGMIPYMWFLDLFKLTVVQSILGFGACHHPNNLVSQKCFTEELYN